jgi:hypothetical protein
MDEDLQFGGLKIRKQPIVFSHKTRGAKYSISELSVNIHKSVHALGVIIQVDPCSLF